MGEHALTVRWNGLVGHISLAGGPTDTRLIPSYGGHIAKVIFYTSKRMPPVLECCSRKKPLEAIIELRDMPDAHYDVLPATLLGRLPYIMHQDIDYALISAFLERWQPNTNTFHMLWGRLRLCCTTCNPYLIHT